MRHKPALLSLSALLVALLLGLSGCACMSSDDDGGSKSSKSSKKKKRSKKKSKKSKKKSKKSSKSASSKSKSKSKPKPKPKPTKEPPTVTWKNNYDMRLEGHSGKANFFLRGGSTDGKAPMFIDVYFNDFPEGTEFKVGTTEATAEKYGSTTMNIDMRPMAGAIKVDTLQNAEVDLGVKVTIEMPEYKPIETKLPPQKAQSAVGAMLSQVRDKPLKFTGEPEDTGKRPAMAIVESGTSFGRFKVLGPANLVWDIDIVGVHTKEESGRTKLCKGYDKAPDGVTIKMVDARVELYDRRSGDLLTEDVVKARNTCPSFVMINRDDMSAKHYASQRDIEAWFRKALRTHGKKR